MPQSVDSAIRSLTRRIQITKALGEAMEEGDVGLVLDIARLCVDLGGAGVADMQQAGGFRLSDRQVADRLKGMVGKTPGVDSGPMTTDLSKNGLTLEPVKDPQPKPPAPPAPPPPAPAGIYVPSPRPPAPSTIQPSIMPPPTKSPADAEALRALTDLLRKQDRNMRVREIASMLKMGEDVCHRLLKPENGFVMNGPGWWRLKAEPKGTPIPATISAIMTTGPAKPEVMPGRATAAESRSVKPAGKAQRLTPSPPAPPKIRDKEADENVFRILHRSIPEVGGSRDIKAFGDMGVQHQIREFVFMDHRFEFRGNGVIHRVAE